MFGSDVFNTGLPAFSLAAPFLFDLPPDPNFNCPASVQPCESIFVVLYLPQVFGAGLRTCLDGHDGGGVDGQNVDEAEGISSRARWHTRLRGGVPVAIGNPLFDFFDEPALIAARPQGPLYA